MYIPEMFLMWDGGRFWVW